ncbi:MAG: hypothetical protein JXA62_00370 [Candidatus Aminicenantes bacterium]|nr:hypothetical protein [Candidatus Aminicenantes bacterium]
MECPHNKVLVRYAENSLDPIQTAMIRDHLVGCAGCRSRLSQFLKVEEGLAHPPMRTPPTGIEKSVMRRLFPVLPTYGSVLTFVAAGFLLLVTWIYVYFDFANNSLVQAMQFTSNRLFRFAGGILQGISTVFSAVYATFKAFSKLISAVLNVQIQAELLFLLLLIASVGSAMIVYHMVLPRRRKQRQTRAI